MAANSDITTTNKATAKLPTRRQAEFDKVEQVIDESTGKVCLPPCQIACPIGEPIQRTNVMISSLPLDAQSAYDQIIKIGDEIYEKNPLFTICSYICGLCEKECNYRDHTGAIRRKMLKRFLTEYYLPHLETKPPFPTGTKEKVAVIGGGPAGLMCAYELSKKGYSATILERDNQLGGALNYIPRYRLPPRAIDITIFNLIRIARIDVRSGVKIGDDGLTLDDFKKEGHRAIFIATGLPSPRPLTINGRTVAGADLKGVMFGLNLLRDVNQGKVPTQLFKGKRVVVLGGGNVAFDVARTARRLGGDVRIVCLECGDQYSKDGIPANKEEIENAENEGVETTYCRGVDELVGEVRSQLLKGVRRRKRGQVIEGKRVIIVGGSNMAFDIARTARRLGGDVRLIGLQCGDKSSDDGIPADVEEIEGAKEEGIEIFYRRGVEEIIGENGKFKKIKCPRCTSVFDDNGFNPKFDEGDTTDIEGDVLLITIGQGPERSLFQSEDLLDERGRLDIDQLTLMSNRQDGIFIGGDVRRVGFAADAMRDGITAAESIDRYLRGEDLKAGREREYESISAPELAEYNPQTEVMWIPAEDRLNFDVFEKGLTLEEAVREATRCLCCGPCKSCKACVALGLQLEIPEIEVNEDLCSGCGICVPVCSYDASSLVESDKGLISAIDNLKCKRCGVCIASCPVGARTIRDGVIETLEDTLAELRVTAGT